MFMWQHQPTASDLLDGLSDGPQWPWSQQHSKAQACPVCHGKGMVPPGFYDVGDTWTSGGSIQPEQCQSCGGSGYVIIPSDVKIWHNGEPVQPNERLNELEQALEASQQENERLRRELAKWSPQYATFESIQERLEEAQRD